MPKPQGRPVQTLRKQIDTYRKKRDAEIRQRVDAGETLERIAVDHGISRERVRQIASGR